MYKRVFVFFIFLFFVVIVMNYFSLVSFAQEKFEIKKVGDVDVISNPKIPIPNDGIKKRIVFKEELSIGEVEGDENYMFGNYIIFNTDDEGNFYVSDSDNHRILKYDPEGKYLLTIGREGQGPGEFQSLSIVRFDKDNHLYVADWRNRRISFFDKNGKFLKQIRMQERISDLYINSKGFIVTNTSSVSQEGNAQKTTAIYGLFDDKFNLATELYKDEIEMPMLTGRNESSLAKFLTQALSQMAFRPLTRYTLANNDFIYLGYPDKYEINIYSPEGKLIRKITRDYESLPVSKKDEENFVKVISTSDDFSSPIFTEDLKKKVFQQIKFRKYKPAYQSFSLMENGWLAVIVDYIKDEYTLFDIFDQEGRYIAHFKTTGITWPVEELFQEFLLFFKNGKAYAVVTEEEYKFVKRYNIELQEFKGNRWVESKIKLKD